MIKIGDIVYIIARQGRGVKLMRIFERKHFLICTMCMIVTLGMAGCIGTEDEGEMQVPQVLTEPMDMPQSPKDSQSETMEEPQPTEASQSTADITAEESIDWFGAYNGDKLQRIAKENPDTYSPAVCSDIIFYEAEEEEEMEDIINKMIGAMIQPLTEPSQVRPFTITEYRLEEQEFYLYDENVSDVWILPYLNGYYSYIGTDFVSMETVVTEEPNKVKDGLIPFMRQGDDEVFAYVLMKEGNVYRLQRAMDME